jgi:hypothetical protein
MKRFFFALWLSIIALDSHGSGLTLLEDEEFKHQCNEVKATLYNGMLIRRDASGIQVSGAFTGVDEGWDLRADMTNDQFYQALLKLSPVYQVTFGKSITEADRFMAEAEKIRQREHYWQQRLSDLIAFYKLQDDIQEYHDDVQEYH